MADDIFSRIREALFPAPVPSAAPVQKRAGAFGADSAAGERAAAFPAYLNALNRSAPRLGTMDADGGLREFKQAYAFNEGGVSDALAMWYANQGFIGHQLCAVLAQNWLINKVCSRPAEDALRHWYDIVSLDGEKLDKEIINALRRADMRHDIKKKLTQFIRKGRIFGCMIAIFKVESSDPEYYETPFNPDGVKPGSYKGVALVEPYWCMPELEADAINAPDSLNFYAPTWWNINGRRYHRSHLAIFAQDEVADILKPTYKYGGIPVPQKILERVYAAERTANEAPHLAMSKRTTILKVNSDTAFADEDAFMKKVQRWVQFRDNHAIKVIDKEDEDVNQIDTTLADFDAVMMSQYQLVAAAGDVPASKLIATTPKGFNATGEYEEASYHETLESIQEHNATPFIRKHHLCVIHSELLPRQGRAPDVDIAWNPLDSPTAKEYAEIRKLDAETDVMLAEASVIDAMEIREKLQADPDAGYPRIDITKVIEPVQPEESGGWGGWGKDADDEFFRSIKKEGLDAGEDKWITVNGARIPLDENGEPKGAVAEKLKKSATKREAKVVEFSGNELGDIENRNMRDVAKEAMSIAREKFAGKSFEATDGEKIDVTWQNIKHGLSNDANPTKAIAATKLDDVISNAAFVRKEKDKENRPHIKAACVYKTDVAIGGKKKQIGLIVLEKSDGKKYYDHFELLDKR
ncbi:MAG: DUF1073 domain-containing protein [Zoogloeaceae bacterium]|nr:DUF1073 domain-containing protein [Zoogloeaceae bacterium]